MMFRRTKARKNGPIKALQPVIGGEDKSNRMVLSKSMSHDSGRPIQYKQHSQLSKDDILMTHSHSKEKVKANPYATIKMWRPTATETSTTVSSSAEDVYHSFTNFDALRLNGDSEWDFRKGNLSSTGDVRNAPTQELSYHRSQLEHMSLVNRSSLSQGQISSETDLTNHKHAEQFGLSGLNGYDELPADYSRDNSPAPIFRRVSFRDKMTTAPPHTNEVASTSSPVHSANPPSLPSSPSLHLTTPMSSLQPSSLSSSKDGQHDTSFQVVSDGTTNSVKLVLSHTYSDIELVGQDVERLLAELKLTMDCLKTSRIDKNAGQLSMCLSELHAQTKQFIREAKLVVSSANNSHEKMVLQLESAVHTLAHVFLHGQATMLLMTSPDHALHLGFQIIKAANSFKSTVSAASLALGKTLNDPNMKYLMRQAQNLATLLASLVNKIKEVQME